VKANFEGIVKMGARSSLASTYLAGVQSPRRTGRPVWHDRAHVVGTGAAYPLADSNTGLSGGVGTACAGARVRQRGLVRGRLRGCVGGCARRLEVKKQMGRVRRLGAKPNPGPAAMSRVWLGGAGNQASAIHLRH